MLFIPFSNTRNPLTRNALLLFIGTDTPEWKEIKAKFKDWSEDHVVDPQLFILGSADAIKGLTAAASSADESRQEIEVIQKLCQVRLLSFSPDGVISAVPLNGNQFSVDGFVDVLKPAVNSFVSHELQTSNVVVAAPPGFYFSKLSNRYASHFIRTESLLSCTTSIELLALRLLPLFANYCDGLAEGKVRVLVDSMAIWPLAQALVSLRRPGDPKRRYVVGSFRSYDGLEEDNLASGSAFVIISASTSGGLERTLLQRLGYRHTECYTILGLRSETPKTEEQEVAIAKKYIFVIPRKLSGQASLDGLRPIFETDISEIPPGCEPVRIIGERFLQQNFRPKAIRLAHSAVDSGLKLKLAKIAREQHALGARRRPGGKSYWPISFDIKALVSKYCDDDSSGNCLLRSWLTNYATPGNVAVVHPIDTLEAGRPDEGEAQRMANRVKALLQEKASGAEIRVIESSQLDNPDSDLANFLSHAGVVIAAPIIGNGFIFKQISAALRATQPKGPRLFLALAVLPDSYARLKELETDLKSNSDERAYHFKSALALPVGKIDLSWLEESELLAKVVESCDESGISVPDLLRVRLQQFKAGNGLSGQLAFAPSYAGAALSMSPGFLLWQTEEPIHGDNLGPGVFLTVAVFLESCRTAGSRGTDTSLISGLFQQTLIAPATFTRFNDTAIQAALLRAAYKSELNFASSPDISSDMQRIILRLTKLFDAPAGEALPEFLLALAMGRMTLQKEHLREVGQAARELPGWLGKLGEQIAVG